MKKIVLLSLIAFGVAACADNRSSVTKDATTWEKVPYQVGGERVKLDGSAETSNPMPMQMENAQ